MTAMRKQDMTDNELDALLAEATVPDLPAGFADRLNRRLEAAPAANVIAFPAVKPRPVRRPWLSALPLAASLAFGLYLGAAGSLPESLASLAPAAIADTADALLGLGIEDTESFLNGDLS
jgi:hypothetical protein